MSDKQKQEKAKQCKNCSMYFWGTIIFLFGLTVYVQIFIDKGLNKEKPKGGPVIVWPKDEFPELDEFQKKAFNKGAKERIDSAIDEHVEAVFVRVDQQIPIYVKYHYSLMGEYAEMAGILISKTSSSEWGRWLRSKIGSSKLEAFLRTRGSSSQMKKILFDDINFKKQLGEVNEKIFRIFIIEISDAMKKVRDKAKNELKFSNRNMNFLYKVMLLTKKDVRKRFVSRLITLRSNGGILLTTAATGEFIAKKIMAKNAVKATAKIAGKAAIKTTVGVGGGAAAGATAGLVCGPLAWVCSPAGAVVGGVTVWVATDKAILEADKYLNQEKFKLEIEKLVGKQKEWMKKQIKNNYYKILKNITQENSRGLEKLKNMSPAEDSAN